MNAPRLKAHQAAPLTALNADRENALALAKKVSKTDLKKLLARAQQQLIHKLKTSPGLIGVGVDAFSTAQLRVTLLQVRAIARELGLNMKDLLKGTVHEAAIAAAGGALKYMQAQEERFSGITERLPIKEALLFDRATQGAKSSLLHRLEDHPTKGPGIMARYGDAVVESFEQTLQTRFVARTSWADTRQQLIDASPFLQGKPASWAERIVRTEVMNVHGTASLDATREAQDVLGDMVKILCATFDNRTGSDSFAVHGQIRRVEEAFNWWEGAYMNPPNRPNDREIVVSHRVSWPIPPELAPRSDSEVAARWREEGRKGGPPGRPKMSTVPREQFGHTAAPEPQSQQPLTPQPVEPRVAPLAVRTPEHTEPMPVQQRIRTFDQPIHPREREALPGARAAAHAEDRSERQLVAAGLREVERLEESAALPVERFTRSTELPRAPSSESREATRLRRQPTEQQQRAAAAKQTAPATGTKGNWAKTKAEWAKAKAAAEAAEAARPKTSFDDFQKAGFRMLGRNDEAAHAKLQRDATHMFGKPFDVNQLRKLTGEEHVPLKKGQRFKREVYSNVGEIGVIAGVGSDSNPTARIQRTFSRTAKGVVAHHDLFVLHDDLQGSGVGKKVLKDQFDEYAKMGVTEITLTAAWKGRYVWPNMGFELSNPRDLATVKLHLKPQLPAGVHSRVDAATSIQDLVRLEHGGEKIVKKAIIEGDQYWMTDYRLDLKPGNPAFEAVKGYLSSEPRGKTKGAKP